MSVARPGIILRLAAVATAWLLVGTAARAEEPARVIHSPWLALRIEQDGAEVPLLHTALLRTRAVLARRPFTVVLPVRGADDDYRLAAWSDDRVLSSVSSESGNAHETTGREEPPFFSNYRCMADTAAGSGTLVLNREGHHCLVGLRLGPDRDRHQFHVSQVRAIGAGPVREIEEVSGPLFLVAYFDEDGDAVPEHGEYELIELQFEPVRR